MYWMLHAGAGCQRVNQQSRRVAVFKPDSREEYKSLREDQENRRQIEEPYIPLSEARANKTKIDWAATNMLNRSSSDAKSLVNHPLEELL